MLSISYQTIIAPVCNQCVLFAPSGAGTVTAAQRQPQTQALNAMEIIEIIFLSSIILIVNLWPLFVAAIACIFVKEKSKRKESLIYLSGLSYLRWLFPLVIEHFLDWFLADNAVSYFAMCEESKNCNPLVMDSLDFILHNLFIVTSAISICFAIYLTYKSVKAFNKALNVQPSAASDAASGAR